jgi:hypothetical protein
MAAARVWVVTVVVAAAVTTTTMSVATAKGGPVTLTNRDEVVFRTNAEDVTLRLVTGKGESYEPGFCDGPGCLPKRCQPIGQGYLAASTRQSVGEGSFDVFRRGDRPIEFVSGGSFGGIVDHPVSWVVVQVAPSVARVEAEFVNGSRDSAEPRKGLVALASPVDDATAAQGGLGQARVVARDADGARLGRVLVRRDMSWPSASTECEVGALPQRFPEPTGRVPADNVAAQASVIAAFDVAYGGTGTDGDALAHVEDGEALREVTDIAAERYPDYAGKITAHVAEVRFVDSDEAAVRFTLDVPSLGPGLLPGGIGKAVLRDGRWLVGRSTFCTLLALGGVFCPVREDAPKPD